MTRDYQREAEAEIRKANLPRLIRSGDATDLFLFLAGMSAVAGVLLTIGSMR